jgi:ubiquinone/menaquinone biosynthesis C-methylase UbiE
MSKGSNNYYSKISKIYDLMYTKENGFDHKAQVLWVDKWRKKLNLPKEVLDLACGTGMHLQYFKQRGYLCQGIDASPDMLSIAKKRLKTVPLMQSYFEEFKLKNKVPMITSFFNALSYNTDIKKLKATFKNVRNNLSENGIFIFDLFCVDKPREVFITKNFEAGNLNISRTIVGAPNKKYFKSTMYYVISDGKKSEIICETSYRGVFSEKQVLSALKDAGFNVLYNGEGYAPEYNVFVAQK